MARPAKRRASPKKARAKRPVARKSRPDEASRYSQLEKRLAEALEQQTATSEILGIIRSSPTDVQPVFDMIADRAMRLCGAVHGGVLRFDGELVHLAAHVHVSPAFANALLRAYPMPPTGRTAAARAILTRTTVQIPDVEQDREYELREAARAAGLRSAMAVPMLRDGQAIGAVVVFGAEPRPFSEAQVRLLQTFADQAVIAVENARVFNELGTRNRDLGESLEQQTATAEILRVISSSPTDVQPVFDAVAESAARLCDVSDVTIFRRDDDRLRLVAHHGPIPVQPILPLVRGTSNGRVVLDGQTLHVLDMQAEAAEFPEGSANARLMGHRTILCVPLMREGNAIGTIHLRRAEAQLFSDRQVALLKTFADQAVIAIENVRLFQELGTRNRDLTETLEQQTATSEILRVISSSPTDVQPVLDIVAESAARLCESFDAAIYRRDGDRLVLVSHHGPIPTGPIGEFSLTLSGTVAGRTVLTGRSVHVADVRDEADEFPETSGHGQSLGFRTILTLPLMREDGAIGAISLRRTEVQLFTERQVALLETFADQAVIAIENVRLFQELEKRNRELTETLEQQTATGEILRVISRSPTDIRPVLDAVAQSATRLCDAFDATIALREGDRLRAGAHHGPIPIPWGGESRPLNRGWVSGRAVVDRQVVHVHDLAASGAEFPLGRADAVNAGHRTTLGVPLLREDQAIGVILIRRLEVRPFTDRQIALLQTFADQAVIAIENVRLFKELETRNHDLSETLAQQTATGEVLKVISRSTFDLQPVLETLIENAARLCHADGGVIYRADGELQRMAAAYNITPALRDYVQQHPLPPGRGTAVGRAMLEGRTVHIHDVSADPGYTYAGAEHGGYHTLLGVPMLREGVPIGVFAVMRRQVLPFTDKQIDLVTTFADQGAIAIENVRLFKELEARNRAVTESLEQQTATSEILRVISSSPTDVQPVLDAVAENAARLCEAEDVSIFDADDGVFRVVAIRGHDHSRGFGGTAVGRDSVAGRAMVDRQLVHVHDIMMEESEFPVSQAYARVAGNRTMLAMPLLREGTSIGVIFVRRTEVRPFSDKQIKLLQTFADQAVIAIENVRLFTELEARTQALTRSVGELRALGEVSQALGSTLDLETVLATIVSRAVQLSGSASGIVYEFDEPTQTFRTAATHQVSPELLEAMRATPIRLGQGAVGRAGVVRIPVQIPDVEDERQLVAIQTQSLLVREGMRSLLAVPLVREDRLLGGLVITRRERGEFSPEIIALLQTFATQSVLAIHNAGLFREIQRQKQYADALVETSPVAIATVDFHGTVVGWNPGAVRLFGHTEAEAIGRNMDELVATPETRDEVRANVRQVIGGERLRTITRRSRKDGTPVDVEVSSMPLIVDGAEVGFIAIYHDITELLRARQEAEAANEAKSAFLATMSHEIRTPMNAVIGMSGLLLNTALTDEQREYAEIVRQSGDALLTVINDILDFSKIEAGRLELEFQPFDLRECVESALDLVSSRAAEKSLDLAYLVGEGTPAGVLGDVTRLRQVLLNLLSNAVKFTERGEVVVSVSARRLQGAPALHELTFSVRDTGIGIPEDRRGRLFQSFSQVDASTTRRYGGTGLGLAISQRLTELMGGRIDVTSEVGRGSEFRFTIRAPATESPAPTRRDLTGEQPSLRGKRVLVVDDNATNRRILAAHLDAWGMLAQASEAPAEALAWIRAGERFDVGILDMHMPGMDGVTLAQAIRECPAGATLPLILFTSLGRREARAESVGFGAYLNKPIKPSQLFDALATVLPDQPVPVPRRGIARSEFDPDMARRHPLRILLAEDNVVNQKLALRVLAQMGYRADLAANGLEAIDAVERQTYDVVLMDVQMPELDGLEASREINRRWPGERRPRLVAMTANVMEGDRELCMAAGMDDYVAKPIRVEDLVAALERSRWRLGVDEHRGPEMAAIDRTAVERLTATMGGPFVAELIDTFVEDGRALVATLRTALAATDVDAFRRAAHSLKSNGATLGATELAALARELEAIARAGSLDGAGERLEAVVARYESAARALEGIRHALPS